MKRVRFIFKSLFISGAFVLFLGLSSCKKEAKEEDPKEVATEQNEQKFDENEDKEDDSAFLVAAAETDLMEIEIGKLAQSKGTNSGVKEFGKMLETDHTKSANDTKPFAEKLQVSLPTAITEKGKEHYNELNGEKAGKDFDKKFADMMVKGHEEAISKMEKASEKATDPEIRAWAAGMVPTLKMHLDHAKMLQEQVDK
jgi:putative membrane protein